MVLMPPSKGGVMVQFCAQKWEQRLPQPLAGGNENVFLTAKRALLECAAYVIYMHEPNPRHWSLNSRSREARLPSLNFPNVRKDGSAVGMERHNLTQ